MEDWHSVCQAIYKGGEGAEWKKLYHKFADMNQAVNVRHASEKSRAEKLWKVRDVTENGDAYKNQISERNIVYRDAGNVGQALTESNTGLG